MKPKLEPPMIILEVVKNYIDTYTFNKLIHEIYYNYKKNDCAFIKIIEKYFDFAVFNKSPRNWQDVWLYNFLMYETKKRDVPNPFKVIEGIDFIGALPKKGLILKYKKYLESIPGREALQIHITNKTPSYPENV